MIEALIFDMDGTLVDSEPVHHKAWEATLVSNGIKSFPFDDFVSYVGSSNEKLASDYIKSHSLVISVEELVLQKQVIYLDMIPAITMIPGARESLQRFCGSFKLGVASSSHRVELDKLLNSLGLGECFDQVVGGDMVENKKPDPDIYLKTIEMMGLKPSQCVAFEDSEAGVHAAKNAGLYTIAVPTSLSVHHDFDRADVIVERIDMVDAQLFTTLATEG